MIGVILQRIQKSGRVGWPVVTFVVTLVIGTSMAGQPGDVFVKGATESEILAMLGARVSIERSKHFVLFSDMGDRKGSGTGPLEAAEDVYSRVFRFCRRMTLPAVAPIQRMVIVSLDDFDILARLAHRLDVDVDRSHGFYDYRTGLSFIANRIGRRPVSGVNREAWLTLVRHEIAHQVFHCMSPMLVQSAPEWVLEGLACVFETSAGTDGEDFPAVNIWRLTDYVDGGADTRKSIRKLFEPCSGQSIDTNGHVQDYAAAWTLVSFLMDERPDPWREYLHRLASQEHRPASEYQSMLFREAFGDVDADFMLELDEWVQRLDRSGRENHFDKPR